MSGLGEETFLPHQSLQSPGSGLTDRNSVTCMSLSQPPWARAWSSLTGLGRGLLTSMKTGGVHATLTSWTSGRIRSARWASQTGENYRRKCPSLPPGEKGAVRPGALGQIIFPWDSLKKQQNSEQLGQSRSHDPPAGSEVPAAGSPVPHRRRPAGRSHGRRREPTWESPRVSALARTAAGTRAKFTDTATVLRKRPRRCPDHGALLGPCPAASEHAGEPRSPEARRPAG